VSESQYHLSCWPYVPLAGTRYALDTWVSYHFLLSPFVLFRNVLANRLMFLSAVAATEVPVLNGSTMPVQLFGIALRIKNRLSLLHSSMSYSEAKCVQTLTHNLFLVSE